MDTLNQRPDLLAPVRGAAQTGTRILATLEYGNRLPSKISQAPRWHLDGWMAGMGIAVLVMAALAWMSREAAISGGPGRSLASSHAALPGQTAPIPGNAISTVTPAAHAYPATAPEPQDTNAATIVSLPEAAPSPLARATATAPNAAASTKVAPPTGPERTVALAANESLTAPASLSPTVMVKSAVPSASRSTTSAASASSREGAGPRATAAASSATQPDTDVALLTALVAHAGTNTTVTPERSRDVVLRQEGEGTTLLLARCKQLGLIEGMLCRSRICSGRWESDPACRAPNH